MMIYKYPKYLENLIQGKTQAQIGVLFTKLVFENPNKFAIEHNDELNIICLKDITLYNQIIF